MQCNQDNGQGRQDKIFWRDGKGVTTMHKGIKGRCNNGKTIEPEADNISFSLLNNGTKPDIKQVDKTWNNTDQQTERNTPGGCLRP